MKYIFLTFILSATLHQSLFCQSRFVATIYFPKNGFEPDSGSTALLNEIAVKCKSDSFGFLRIFGFTDTIGSEKYNEILSKKRVSSVYAYINSLVKIDKAKLYFEWFGESNEVYDLHFPKAHIRQRSVDIIIEFYKSQAKK